MLSLNIPEYESAAARFIAEVMSGFLDSDPLFENIEREISVHRGPIRNVPGDPPLDQDMFQVRGEAALSWDTVRNSKIDDYVCFLVSLSESQRKSLAREFFRNIGEITDVTGRTVNAKGKSLSVDMILDLIEKVEFGFDEEGNPQYPTLVVPPVILERLKELKPTPEQEERKRRVIEEKRRIFNAKKRTRRLSR